MDYTYMIEPSDATRIIQADFPDAENPVVKPNHFQTIEFSPKDLDAENNLAGFAPSRLETLVTLFTNRDPSHLLEKMYNECPHDDTDFCECPLITINISPLLAHHIATLHKEIKNLEGRIPTPEAKQNTPPEEVGDTPVQPESRRHQVGFDNYQYHLTLEKSRILDRWFDQGIAIFESLPED